MSWGGHLNLIWKGILLGMYAQQAPLDPTPSEEKRLSTNRGKWNKKSWRNVDRQ